MVPEFHLALYDSELPPELERELGERVERLGRSFPPLVACSLLVEASRGADPPGSPGAEARRYDVHLDLGLPDAEPILIDRWRRRDLAEALRELFEVATRRLEALARLRSADELAAGAK